MCRCCNISTGSSIFFNIRGITGLRHTGRVFVKGTIICDDCAAFFENAF